MGCGASTVKTSTTTRAVAEAEKPQDAKKEIKVEDIPATLRRHLPIQLHHLPAAKLGEVYTALSVLVDVGILGVSDVGKTAAEITEKLKVGRECIPLEDFTSEYSARNTWAWTRSRWKTAVTLLQEKPACNAQGLGSNAENEPLSETYDFNIEAARKKFHKFNGGYAGRLCERKGGYTGGLDWFAALEKASAEIHTWAAVDEVISKSNGDGSACLFELLGARTVPAQVAPQPRSIATGKFARKAAACLPAQPSVVVLHLGQSGVSAGNAYWQRLYAEHNLCPDGRANGTSGATGTRGLTSVHFNESARGRFVPRSIFAAYGQDDMSLVTSSNMFFPGDLYVGTFDSVYDSMAKRLGEFVEEAARRQSEACDNLAGHMMTAASYDLMSVLLLGDVAEKLSVNYNKRTKWLQCETTGLLDASINAFGAVEERQQLLQMASLRSLAEYVDIVNLHDKPSLTSLVSKKDHGSTDSVLSRIVSAWTSPIRFGGLTSIGSALNPIGLTTNLCPYPRIHFCVPSVGGLCGGDCLTSEALLGRMASSVRYSEGMLVAAALICRGVEHPMAATKIAEHVSSANVKTVYYNPVGYTVASHSDPSLEPGEAVSVCFHNHTSVNQLLKQWVDASMVSSEVKPDWYRQTLEQALWDDDVIQTMISEGQDLILNYNEVAAETPESGCEEAEQEEY